MLIEGAMTALVTPFRGGAVDEDALAALVDAQIAAGIDALVAVGTTGESPTLSFAEHVRVVERVVGAARRRVPVIAGAGANSTSEAIELSHACREVGADGLLHVTPYYNKPTQEGLYRHFAAVAEAARLPIVLYNVPGRTAVDLLAETVARLAAFDNVVAVKEASGNVVRTTQIIGKLGDRMTVLAGDDAIAMPLYAVGARGVISVVSNVAPRWIAEMWDAAAAGDWARARALHYQIQPLTELLFAETSPAPIKAALALTGAIGDEIRLPLAPCSAALAARLREHMSGAGLL